MIASLNQQKILRHAKSFNSSLVIGPVVSCDPTLVILGSQYVFGYIPSTPQALPTIFCAKVNPFVIVQITICIFNKYCVIWLF